MRDPQLLDYLLGDEPMADLDTLVEFNEEELPQGLAERTLNRVALERTQLTPVSQNRFWHRGIPAILAVAASLILVFSLPKSDTNLQGNLENMTAKGLEQSAPKVHLKLARLENGEAVRHRTDHAYSAGEALLFRVQSNAAGWVTLLNVQEGRLSPILQSPIESGNNDLALSNGEIAQWLFDSTDRSGFFAVISSETAVPSETLVQQFQDASADPLLKSESFCLSARALGWQCDAIEVMVTE